MEHINLLFVAVGFFLSASHLFVQTLPIRYHENNLAANAAPIQTDALTEINNDPLGSWGLSAPNNDTVEMVMFPMLADIENKVQHPNKPNEPGDRSSDNSNSATATKQTEMTVAIRNYKTDSLGNYRFLRVTQDDSVGDVSLKQYMRGNPLKPRAPEVAQRRSYNIPGSTKYPVCFGSTIYNFPKQVRYLRPRLYNRIYDKRPVWLELRQGIYNDAKSQECHKWNLTNWDKYIYCAIMRNMRMEYLVPKYPLHQQGGYFYLREYTYKYPDDYYGYYSIHPSYAYHINPSLRS